MTAGTLQLREVTWPDVAALADAERRLFGVEGWSAAAWWSELAARPRRTYVILTDELGHLLGYAGLGISGQTADVMTIAVEPHARGRGYGRLLLDWLTEAAAEIGAQDLMLEVRADNRPAHTLYQHSGFETVSVRRRYYQPSDVDAVVMRKVLP